MYDNSEKVILIVQNDIESLKFWKSCFLTQNCRVILTPPEANTIAKIVADCYIDLVVIDLNIDSFNPYVFCRQLVQDNFDLQVIFSDRTRKTISDLEMRWATLQGAKDIILGFANTTEMSESFRKLFQKLGWHDLYDSIALDNFLATVLLKSKTLQKPVIKTIFGKELTIDSTFARNLCHQMYSNSDLEIKDRRWRLRIFHKCFIGQEAVNWLYKHLQIPRSQAIQVGQKLLEQGHIFHVLQEHDFEDGYFFYRFSMNGFPSQRIFSRDFAIVNPPQTSTPDFPF